MTTIAVRKYDTYTQIAADTLVSAGGSIFGYADKIIEQGDIIIAIAGTVRDRQAIERLDSPTLEAIAELLGVHEESCAIVLQHGKVYEVDPGAVLEVEREYHAVGSGADIAMGAMSCGADPNTAVESAMKHDLHTGGRIQYLTQAAEERLRLLL